MTPPTSSCPSLKRRYAQKAVDALIQWSPLGSSGWATLRAIAADPNPRLSQLAQQAR